jgi:hypothetical protein
MNNLVSRLLPACLLGSALVLVLMVSGCGVTSVAVGSGSSPSKPSNASPSATGTGGTGKPTPTRPAGSLPSSTAQLSCVLQVTARPVDDLGETLHCTVSHMPSSQRTFVLHYSVQTNAGTSIVIPPVCQGTLFEGSGTCTAILTSPLPQALTRGVVSGSTQPDQYLLGPIHPKQASGVAPTGTPLPFQPHG